MCASYGLSWQASAISVEHQVIGAHLASDVSFDLLVGAVGLRSYIRLCHWRDRKVKREVSISRTVTLWQGVELLEKG